MKKRFLCLFVLGLVFFTAQNASAVFLDFGDLTTGQIYEIGDSFTTGISVDVSVEGLVSPLAIDVTHTSYVQVVNPGSVIPGNGNELKIVNALLNFEFDFGGCPSCGIALFFAEYGDLINLGVNGHESILTGEDFLDLDGALINGANIFVSPSANGQGAMMVIGGYITSFQIGGEDLYIDNMLVCEGVPEPTTIVLLGLGGLSLLARKRRNS